VERPKIQVNAPEVSVVEIVPQDVEAEIHNLMGIKIRHEELEKKRRASLVRLNSLKQSVAEKSDEIAFMHVVEKALLSLPEHETKLTLAKLSMEDVKISLDGDVLSITDSRGVPYDCLSTGKKMKVDLRIAEVIQKLLGASAPGIYFFDDADLVDNYDSYLPKSGQVLIASVDPTATELKVVQLQEEMYESTH
jgi:hypothetical protein